MDKKKLFGLGILVFAVVLFLLLFLTGYFSPVPDEEGIELESEFISLNETLEISTGSMNTEKIIVPENSFFSLTIKNNDKQDYSFTYLENVTSLCVEVPEEEIKYRLLETFIIEAGAEKKIEYFNVARENKTLIPKNFIVSCTECLGEFPSALIALQGETQQ